jgi:N-acetylglutamate synthase-like GNAT family acetyltransferase
MSYVIRRATENEAGCLTAIIREASRDVAERFDLTPENCPRHPSNCVPEWVEAGFEKGILYYVLEASGTPCGCVALERASDDVCYLERLTVLTEYQRQGFGTALVNHVCGEARRLGAKRVEIGTIAEHGELTRWYEKLGFCHKNTAVFEHLPFTVAFMSKELVD